MTEAEARLAQIEATMEGLRVSWPFFLGLLNERIDSLTTELIGQDDEQKRGRIKALLDLKRLPETLLQERDGIRAGLAD